MCIVTITLPVQSKDNELSCVLLPLHYLYKAKEMSGHENEVPVASQGNEWSFI